MSIPPRFRMLLGPVATLVTLALALFITGMVVTASPQVSPSLEAASVALAPDPALDQFQLELKAALDAQHRAQMEALEAQRTVLQKLEQSVQQLLAQAKAPAPAPVPEPTKAQPVPEPTKAQPVADPVPLPVRRSSTIWNLNNTWDYSTEELIAHLLGEHGFDAAGYSREELQTIHDNLHNGYTALGDAVVQAVPAPVTYYSTVPLRRGMFFRSAGNCAGGTCPTP